jgi:serine/threonine-protein phosphatase 6 regulatory ankyrin repeat subunit B
MRVTAAAAARRGVVLVLIATCLATSVGVSSFRARDRRAALDGTLLKAATTGNDAVAIAQLRGGADPDARFRSVARRRGWQRLRDALSNVFTGTSSEARHLDDGKTALMLAARGGHIAVVRELLDRGAAIEARDRDGGNALMTAAGAGHDEIVRLLLARGADPNARTAYGFTPLMAAASGSRTGWPACAETLLRGGARVNAKDRLGSTALMGAATRTDTAITRVLLRHGAAVHARDGQGETALDWARRAQHLQHLDDRQVRLLQQAGARSPR